MQEKSINTSFATLGLAPELLRAVADQGYTTPTPIQAQAIPVVLSGKDLLGAAQTGTGKTAGFTLPLLQILSAKANASHSPARHPIRALVITPTRELCAQVEDSVRTYGKYVKLKSITVYGGVGINPQIDALRKGVDILVATPGRLLDHVQQRTVDLRQVEILVLDEADRMLDMGFIHDIRKILALLPAKRQNLLFSATFPDEIRKLASSFMHQPVTVEVARRNTPAELVSQVAHPVDGARKRELLGHLVKSNDWKQVLVFCRTKHGANRLAQQLSREGINADAIHGNKSQNQRERALAEFKEGKVRVLVATDIAARGLDIEALPHVVNYDLPHVAEDYVHRIGRTGRAGAEGEAVSFVSAEERPLMAAIERLINRKVESRTVEGFHPGSAAPRVAQQEPSRNNVRRHPRAEFQPRGNGQRRGSGQHRGNGQHWGNGQSRGNGQPSRDGQRRPERAPTASARDDQLREARARMAAEGEKLPQRSHRAPARSSRQQRWDPRRSEPQEPAYAHPGKPAPSRPAPVIQRKRSFAGMVGALLGRKTETEE
ncbi:MAG TPA: DEAD/DEAH box helicase [Burkholderiales bacterium]|nr:DEAD/DEAH box helicase [Burkholderiales bacterium]